MKYLCIIPSNQDRNVYGGGQHTEYEVMHRIAETAVAAARGWPGLTVRMIPGQRESADARRCEGLYRQQAEAVTWLREQGADPRSSAIVNLHSDSGKAWSHVLGCYGGEKGGASYQLADTVSLCVEDLIATGDRRLWDYSPYLFYALTRPWAAALIELGSHEHPRDMDILLNRQPELADRVLAGAVGYLGLRMPPEPVRQDPDEVYFSTFGIPCNPESAIYRYWKACRAIGDVANLGPAIAPEEPGEPYGEKGCTVQRFTNAIVVTKPQEGWRCYRAQAILEPQRWGLCRN